MIIIEKCNFEPLEAHEKSICRRINYDAHMILMYFVLREAPRAFKTNK